MKNAGVASKQADKARQALMRSATTAGFFIHGSRTKLIVPPGTRDGGGAVAPPNGTQTNGHQTPTPPIPTPDEHTPDNSALIDGIAAKLTQQMAQLTEAVLGIAESRQDVSPSDALHPAIQGMLATLPHGEDPTEPPKWSYKKLQAWARTFTSVLEVVYEDADPPVVPTPHDA